MATVEICSIWKVIFFLILEVGSPSDVVFIFFVAQNYFLYHKRKQTRISNT